MHGGREGELGTGKLSGFERGGPAGLRPGAGDAGGSPELLSARCRGSRHSSQLGGSPVGRRPRKSRASLGAAGADLRLPGRDRDLRRRSRSFGHGPKAGLRPLHPGSVAASWLCDCALPLQLRLPRGNLRTDTPQVRSRYHASELRAAKTSDFATSQPRLSSFSANLDVATTLRGAPLPFSTSLPFFQGPSGKIDVVTTRSEAFCQIRRFYHADRPLFRPKQGKGTTPGNRVNQARVAPGATQFLRDTIYAWADSVE